MLQRDQVSNTCKPISDAELSDKQFEMRTKQHPKTFAKPEDDFTVGDLVFLKLDKSKLRGREMYRIVELFQTNGEPCAKIQNKLWLSCAKLSKS